MNKICISLFIWSFCVVLSVATESDLHCPPGTRYASKRPSDFTLEEWCEKPTADGLYIRHGPYRWSNGNGDSEIGQYKDGFRDGKFIGSENLLYPVRVRGHVREYRMGQALDDLETCPLTKKDPNVDIIFYSRRGRIIPLLFLEAGQLTPFKGTGVSDITTVFNLRDRKPWGVHFTSGEGGPLVYCMYSAEIVDHKMPDFSIFATADKISLNFSPSLQDRSNFESTLDNACHGRAPKYTDTNIGDCDPSELIAVSDINKNGKPEYWHTVRYKWDNAFSVGEWNSQTRRLEQINENCSLCSD